MAVVALVVAVGALLAVAAVAVLWRPGRVLAARRGRRCVVSTKSGATIDGRLKAVDRDVLVLRQARLIEGDGSPTPADGELIVDRSEVTYLQLP